MTVTMKRYGSLRGELLYEYTLTNRNGMVVRLLNYGATLEAVLVPEGDHRVDVILSLEKPADYHQARNFLGGTVGRIVGRLPGHVWHFGEQTIELPKGEGDNAIHGGPDGLDRQVFTGTYRDNTVTFTFLDPAGHNDFPGNVKVSVAYTLDDTNTLHYQLHAVSDAATLFNPTNHVYFALDGPTHSVADTQMQLACDYYAPIDAAHLPTQGFVPVTDTVFDFTTAKRLGDVIPLVQDGAGLDHPFLTSTAQCATLTGQSGRTVKMTTSAPAVVVYTANHFDHTGIAKNIGKHAGVTLEAQIPPASGLDWSAITLLPQQPYTLTTSWQFGGFDQA